MNTASLFVRFGTFSCAALFAASSFAAPSSSTNTEPDRIFNAVTRNWEPNPNYHEPKPAVSHTAKTQRGEPQRIFNAITRNWEANPDYHEPVARKSAARPVITEPDRIFNAQTGQWEANPDARK